VKSTTLFLCNRNLSACLSGTDYNICMNVVYINIKANAFIQIKFGIHCWPSGVVYVLSVLLLTPLHTIDQKSVTCNEDNMLFCCRQLSQRLSSIQMFVTINIFCSAVKSTQCLRCIPRVLRQVVFNHLFFENSTPSKQIRFVQRLFRKLY